MDSNCIFSDTLVIKMYNATDSVFNAVNTIPVKTNSETNVFDMVMTLSICAAVVGVFWIIANFILQLYKTKEKEKYDEIERKEAIAAKWFSLKKEYQENVIKYLEKATDKRYDNNEESHIEFIKAHINQIDEYLNLPRVNDNKHEQSNDGQVD